MQSVVVQQVNGSMRLDKYLRHRFPEWGRQAVGRLIASGDVRVNGRFVHLNSWQVQNGDRLDFRRIPAAKPAPVQQFDDDWLLAETADLLAINKPAGLLSQPTAWRKGSNLLDLVQARFGKAVLFHRLDRDTSGVVLFSRSRAMNQYLDRLFQQRLVKKWYLAVVTLPNRLASSGEIRVRLGADPQRRDKVTAVSRGGKWALTKYEVLAEQNGRQWVGLQPVTGRTHQLRVHLAHLGAPIVGDRLYGGAAAPRLLLHARRLWLPNEAGETRFCFETAVPPALNIPLRLIPYQ